MTIFALSSGPGLSGVAVIRISGEETPSILKLLTKKDLPSPRVATLSKIINSNNSELIDEALVLWFPGPNSYTGEDMAEFHVHGSMAVIKAIHKALEDTKKCRIAEPGEFTKKAFQNGKINLLKAESIADLISSETEIQRKQAIATMSGKTSRIFNEMRDLLLKSLSNIEAKIDFPEEELSEEVLSNTKENIDRVIQKIQKILNDQKVGERIREGFKIAIVGPTNAGKSSLLNHLSNRDVAIVSEIAGTTRDVLETHLNIDGYPVIISDTAGIREAKSEIEQKGIKLALKKAEEADLNLIVIEPKSLDFTGFLKDLINPNSILVINKCDIEKVCLTEQMKKIDHVIISVKNNTNIDKLISTIKSKLKGKFIRAEEILITRERHRVNLEQCLENLINFQNKKNDFDKAAEDLRLATRHLGIIVGKVEVEEILGSIFNDFCIGK